MGVMSYNEAMDKAIAEDLDLVLISADASPPVCRIMDASKHKYELEKADKESKKKQREARWVGCTYIWVHVYQGSSGGEGPKNEQRTALSAKWASACTGPSAVKHFKNVAGRGSLCLGSAYEVDEGLQEAAGQGAVSKQGLMIWSCFSRWPSLPGQAPPSVAVPILTGAAWVVESMLLSPRIAA